MAVRRQQPQQERRQKKAVRALAIAPLAALAVYASRAASGAFQGARRSAFVGPAALGGLRGDVALKAEGAGFGEVEGKKKQKLSLKEALDRQKEKAVEQVEKKEDAKLEKEVTFFEGPPSSTEVLWPFLSCFFVIGIIPFISSVNRQFKVKYKITNARISVSSGWDGKDVTEFSYQEIYEIQYGLRFFGYCGDMRIDLRDGARVELFGLLNFFQNYNFILDRVDKDCLKRSSPRPETLE